MIVRTHLSRAAAISTFAAGLLLAAAAPGQTPAPRADDCKELTGAERTRCEAHANPGKKEASRDEAPPPAASSTEADAPPPDTKSDSDDRSDTADPPQG